MISKTFTFSLDGYNAPSSYDFDGYAIATSFDTNAIGIRRSTGYSVSVTCPSTGSPAGTIKLQACNDDNTSTRTELYGSADLTNWIDVPSGGNRVVSGSVSNATTLLLTDDAPMYKWVRLVYTRSGGTGTFTIKIHVKEDR